MRNNYLLLIVTFWFWLFTQCMRGSGEILANNTNCDFKKLCTNSGECIPMENFCDGKIDCKDGSDETPDSCIHIKCPKYSFQCSYGACINKELKCNNIQNCADNSDEGSYMCGYINKSVSGNCRDSSEYQCKSGECIPVENACDGKMDCPDGSDETVGLCSGLNCSSFAFKCGYGACIRSKLKCNGIDDCLDGSDELPILCGDDWKKPSPPVLIGRNTTKIPFIVHVPEGSCVISQFPGLIVRLNSTGEIIPTGQYVEEFQQISYECGKGYVRVGDENNYCISGVYVKPEPTCLRNCPSQAVLGETFETECFYNNEKIFCETDILLPGTIATTTCKPGYQDYHDFTRRKSKCDNDGEWINRPFSCVQICGIVPPKTQEFIVGGSPVDIPLPWHVGIFLRSNNNYSYEQICGGTIISAKIVLSAAHCFWNKSNEIINDYSKFMVAAGKYYRNFSAIEPLSVQYFNLSRIFIPERYTDFTGYHQSDFAILVLNKFIEFKAHIRPICIQWFKDASKNMLTGQRGIVAGWGKIGIHSYNSTSNELRRIELDSLSNADCKNKASIIYEPNIGDDKFCVESTADGGLCKGDSGGGFVVPKININNIKKYYLWGIVSNGLNSFDKCEGMTTLTNIQYYSNEINEYESSYAPR